MSNSPSRLTHAQILWHDQTPTSSLFGDVYFSDEDGIAETQHVFINNNRLMERWQQLSTNRFTIGETGFGTGLNFMCALQLWCSMNRGNRHLHYVSVEKFPLRSEDLLSVATRYPQFDALYQRLILQYPANVRGFHRLFFPDLNVTLNLLFGDASEYFQTLDGQVDAWFLDGFAPSVNPDMWQPALFSAIARLSKPGATLATFTCAGVVKRGLMEAGFNVKKVPGHGRKREILTADYTPEALPTRSFKPQQKPWFHFPYETITAATTPTNVAIIGAGLAGCAVARCLAQRGFEVTVYDTEVEPATQASGNPTGMTFTKLSVHDIPQNRYYQSAFLYSCRWIRKVLEFANMAEGEDWNFNGIIQLAFNEQEANDQQLLLDTDYWPTDWLQPLTVKALKTRYNVDSQWPGILLTQGGWLNPRMLCDVLLKHRNIKTQLGVGINNMQRLSHGWQLNTNGESYSAVVLASAFSCNQFSFTDYLPLRSVRGQVTYLPANPATEHFQHAINYDGYINPAWHGFHCVGATFNPKITTPQLRSQDHEWNYEQLRSSLPQLAQDLAAEPSSIAAGRVGFRCQTPDYLPIVGPLPDPDYYKVQYADLAKGFLKREFPVGEYLPGLFISTGHGSRGITSAPFAAEIVSSYITGEPQAVDREVLRAIHPARFLVRNIVRRVYD